MDNLQKTKSVFYSLAKFKEYKSLFFIFLFVIAIPLLIIETVITYKFYLTSVSYVIDVILYMIMFLFVNSFIVLHRLAEGKKLSFSQVFKFIPSIIPYIIFPVLVFTILFVIFNRYFFIATFILFVYMPIVSFAPLFNKTIAFYELVDVNKSFQKTEIGKKLLKTNIILSAILFIVLFVLKSFFIGLFSYSSDAFITSLSVIIIGLLHVISFFIIYFTIVYTYSEYTFILPDNIYKIAPKIIFETKNIRKKRRDIYSKKHSNKRESIFDFEKEDEKPKTKERNRFLEDGGYNRFEDTKF